MISPAKLMLAATQLGILSLVAPTVASHAPADLQFAQLATGNNNGNGNAGNGQGNGNSGNGQGNGNAGPVSGNASNGVGGQTNGQGNGQGNGGPVSGNASNGVTGNAVGSFAGGVTGGDDAGALGIGGATGRERESDVPSIGLSLGAPATASGL